MWLFRRRSKNDIPTFAVENTIGAGTTVRGGLAGPGGFCIDGVVEGSLVAEGPVIVGETGVVSGSVRGRDVVVLGRVRGDVETAGHLEIGPRGAVVGDVTVASFRMHKGGVFRGTSRMTDGDVDVHALSAGAAPEPARTRTLPPAAGGVPPPPTAAESGHAPRVPDDLASQKRLVADAASAARGETAGFTLKDDEVVSVRDSDGRQRASG